MPENCGVSHAESKVVAYFHSLGGIVPEDHMLGKA
jgi:hypothetical protein